MYLSALQQLFQTAGKPYYRSQLATAAHDIALYGGNNRLDLGRPMQSSPEVAYSGLHMSIAMYIARLSRCIWCLSIRDLFLAKREEQENVRSVLLAIQSRIIALRTFLEEHVTSEKKSAQKDLSQKDNQSTDAEAQNHEQQKSTSLYHLTVHMIEGISFLVILMDANVSSLQSLLSVDGKESDSAKQLSKALQERLQTLDFASLITTMEGRQVAKELLFNLLSSTQTPPSSDISTDSRSAMNRSLTGWVQTRCAHFFSGADMSLYRATEWMQRAKATKNNREKDAFTSNAFNEYVKIGQQMPHLFGVEDFAAQEIISVDDHSQHMPMKLRECARDLANLNHYSRTFFLITLLNDETEHAYRGHRAHSFDCL